MLLTSILWLAGGLCIFQAFFLADSSPHFIRLHALFAEPMTEVYLLFFQSALQSFIHFNLFLQREDPLIPILYEQIHSFLTKLASKFMPVLAIKETNGDFESLDYKNQHSQLPGMNDT